MAHFYENLKTVEDYHASEGIEEERYTEVAEASKASEGDDKAKGAEASKEAEASKGAEGAKASEVAKRAEAVTVDDVKDLVNAAMEGLTDKLKFDILSATKIMSTNDGVEDGGAGGSETKKEE